MNLLDNNLLKSYFDVKEAETYYVSVRTPKESRDFSIEFLKVAGEYLDQMNNASAYNILNNIIFKLAPLNKIEQIDQSEISIDRLTNISEEGVYLLGLDHPVTFNKLKKCYRTAALKYHPDLGGSKEKMQLINESYAIFHELICYNQSKNFNYRISKYDNAHNFTYYIKSLCLIINIDIWNIPQAYSNFSILKEQNIFTEKYYRFFMFKSGAKPLFGVLSTLIKRLIACKMLAEAKTVSLVLLENYKDSVNLRWVNEETARKEITLITKYLNIERKVQFSLNHELQIENALKFNAIDEYRSNRFRQKLDESKDHEHSLQKKLDIYLSNYNFIPLSTENLKPNVLTKSLRIPHPNAFYIENLDEDQLYEYNLTFTSKPSLSLIRKYCIVRLNSLLRAFVLNFDEINHDDIIREVSLIREIQPFQTQRSAIKNMCDYFLNFVKYTKNPRVKNIDEKMRLLREIEVESKRIDEIEGIERKIGMGYYYEAKRPLKQLRSKASKLSNYRKRQ
jgi:hypothetical protein